MSVITNNTIQPSSGQALTIKDEGGTASITIQTDGDLTLAENAYLGSGKGIYFDGQTTSANFLDDYEEGTWTPTINTIWSGPNNTGFSVNSAKYTKIGNQVTLEFSITQTTITSPNIAVDDRWQVTGLPFTPSLSNGGSGVAQISNSFNGATVGFFNLGVTSSGLRFWCTHAGNTQNYTMGNVNGSCTYKTS